MAVLISEILFPTYGYDPLSITQRRTPQPQRSASIVDIPSKASGARYKGVPTIIPVYTSFCFANFWARPKSISLNFESSFSLAQIMFSGFISL